MKGGIGPRLSSRTALAILAVLMGILLAVASRTPMVDTRALAILLGMVFVAAALLEWLFFAR